MSALSVRLDKGEVTAALRSFLILGIVLGGSSGTKEGPTWKYVKAITAWSPECPMGVCELGHGKGRNCKIVWGTKERDLFALDLVTGLQL